MAQKLDGIAPRRGAGKENSGLFPAVPGALDQLRSEPDNHPQTHGQSLGSGRRDHPRSTWNPISAQNRRGNSGLPGHPGRRSGFVSQRLRRATTFLRIHLQQVSQIPTGAEPGSNPKAVEMTKEENPQNQNRDFPLSWKAPTPRFPHSHRHGYCSSSIGQANQTIKRKVELIAPYTVSHPQIFQTKLDLLSFGFHPSSFIFRLLIFRLAQGLFLLTFLARSGARY